jgi:hypothetical protein
MVEERLMRGVVGNSWALDLARLKNIRAGLKQCRFDVGSIKNQSE